MNEEIGRLLQVRVLLFSQIVGGLPSRCTPWPGGEVKSRRYPSRWLIPSCPCHGGGTNLTETMLRIRRVVCKRAYAVWDAKADTLERQGNGCVAQMVEQTLLVVRCTR